VNRTSKPKTEAFLQYVVHPAMASYGVMILGAIFVTRRLEYYFFAPRFLFPIAVGLTLGFGLGARLPKLSSRLLFIFSLAMTVWELWAWIAAPEMTLHRLADNFVGTNCSSSECLGQLLITSPLISSLTYAVGAELGRSRNSFRRVKASST
jgi:hypothetical protein